MILAGARWLVGQERGDEAAIAERAGHSLDESGWRDREVAAIQGLVLAEPGYARLWADAAAGVQQARDAQTLEGSGPCGAQLRRAQHTAAALIVRLVEVGMEREEVRDRLRRLGQHVPSPPAQG